MRMRGLTLVEVFVVVLIVFVLLSMIIPLNGRPSKSARKTQCASNIRQIMTAMYMYADDASSNGYLPTLGSKSDPFDQKQPSSEAIHLLYRQFIADPRVFSCPSDPNRPAPAKLQSLQRSNIEGTTTFTLALGYLPMTPADISYSYDPGHSSDEDLLTVYLADDPGTGVNSDNHGANAGQNVGFGTTVEFRENPKQPLKDGKFDPNIYALNARAGSPMTRKEDSFLRP